MKEKLNTWNLRALIALPIIAVITASITIEVDLKALLTIAVINFIPILISCVFAGFLLNKATQPKSQFISVISPITISFSTSLWYVLRVFLPVENAPGIEHLAIPQMILFGAVIFGLLSIPMVFYTERKL